MLTSFINQRGTLTSYSLKRLADERQDAKSSPQCLHHSDEMVGLAGLSMNQFGVNVEFIGTFVATFA